MTTIVLSHCIPTDYYQSFTDGMRVLKPEVPLACWTREEAAQVLKEADVFICIADYKLDRSLIDEGTHLSTIGVVGSGYDNVDWKYAQERGIHVINAPSSLIDSTSEMTIALMLSLCRGVVQYDRELRRDLVMTRQLYFERDMVLYNKTLGVIGMGRIGKSVAAKAHALGMSVIYSNAFAIPEEEAAALGGAQWLPTEEVLRRADVITIHVPYTQDTHHLIDAKALSLMKPTAYLINAARGPIVEEAAILEALRSHAIKGAALDVHEFEPNVNPEIAKLDNIVITPHCCTNVAEVRVAMLHETLTGVCKLLAGERPRNLVV